ncbi:unnamed protein product [Caenorhabditis sp. 36 PRJEB53466]|nr:unnamed protein product [Caenorhabditis sp. 36 PRJEB53466]
MSKRKVQIIQVIEEEQQKINERVEQVETEEDGKGVISPAASLLSDSALSMIIDEDPMLREKTPEPRSEQQQMEATMQQLETTIAQLESKSKALPQVLFGTQVTTTGSATLAHQIFSRFSKMSVEMSEPLSKRPYSATITDSPPQSTSTTYSSTAAVPYSDYRTLYNHVAALTDIISSTKPS